MDRQARVKICGVTNAQQAEAIAGMGAWAVGFNFVEGAARQISCAEAARASEGVASTALRVGVFRDPETDWVKRVTDQVALDVLQFHGEETASFCVAFERPYWKSIAMTVGVDVEAYVAQHREATAFLLDTARDGRSGGTGERFDWRLWPQGLSQPLILAGGLDPDNVREAQQTLQPWAVDVASGVETAGRKGWKDLELVERFIDAAHGANHTVEQSS